MRHLVETPHTRIVSLDLFKRVQAIRDRDVEAFKLKARRIVGPDLRKFILSGKISCPCCDSTMVVTHGYWGDRRIKCANNYEHRGCTNRRNYSLKKIERIAVAGLRGLLLDPQFEETYLGEIRRCRSAELDRIESDRVAIEARIIELDAEVDRAMKAVFTDPRLTEKMESVLQPKLDELENLRLKKTILPSELIQGFDEGSFPTLAESLDEVWIRAPFEARNAAESNLRRTLQAVIDAVRVTKSSRFDYDVEVDYNLAGIAVPGMPVLTRRFENQSSAEDLDRIVSKNAIAKAIMDSGEVTLSDEEYAHLSTIPLLGTPFWKRRPAELRLVLNAFIVSMTADAAFRNIMLAGGSADKAVYNAALDLRRSEAFVANFRACLLSLRPSGAFAFEKLESFPRPTRLLRYKLKKIDHPILRLPLFSESSSGLVLSDEQWAAIEPHVQKARFLHHKHSMATRNDVDSGAWVIRNEVSWDRLSSDLNRSPSNTAQRFTAFLASPSFQQATLALLRLDGLHKDGEQLDVPMFVRTPRSKR